MRTLKQIFTILTRKEKILLFFLLCAMIAGAFFELFGISVLLPIITLISSDSSTLPSVIEQNTLLRILVHVFDLSPSDPTKLFVVVICFVMAVYILKAIYSICLSAWLAKYTNNFRKNLSVKLFKVYLLQPYDFHLYRNTADLLQSATYDSGNFIGAISTLLSLASDLIFCIALTVYLFVVDWRITLIVIGVIGSLSILLLALVKKKVRAYGNETWWLNSQSNKTILESLGGIKETIVSGREPYFIDRYSKLQSDMADVGFKNTFISILPRTILEAVGMISILCALLIYVVSGVGNSTILGTFSLFVVAVVKLLPYVSRFNGELNALRFSMRSVHCVYDDLKLAGNEAGLRDVSQSQNLLSFRKEVRLDDVSFCYKGSAKLILNHVFCCINKGQSTAFCGASGAGKTTTVDIILGLLSPNSGDVLCDGVSISGNVKGWHKNISYIPQDIFLVDDSIRNNVAFGLDSREVKDEDVWRALEEAQLGDFVRNLPGQLDSQIGEKGVRLSGGQRQRIGIARALFRNTQIIVFDEATSALDYQTEGEILKTVNGLRGSKTLIIITHRLNTIQNCDRIYEIKEGKMTCIKGGEPDAH